MVMVVAEQLLDATMLVKTYYSTFIDKDCL